MNTNQQNTDEKSFEEHLEALETIVDELETGELSLEDMLRRYEDGMNLIATCQHRLEAAELRVTEIAAETNATQDA